MLPLRACYRLISGDHPFPITMRYRGLFRVTEIGILEEAPRKPRA